jgi:hypothetical protein
MRRAFTYCRNALIGLVLMVSLALGGCASTAPVYIPTPVPCVVVLPATPDFPFDKLAAGADIHTQTKTLLADRRVRIDDRRQLVAAAGSCS